MKSTPLSHLHVDDELPPLAALFLIHFDTKKGYTIEWHQTASPDVDLDGVEFKSLPSGLHNLSEDLVYFVHGAYAGLSAFLHVDAGEEERGALMISAGLLVPLSYGRLGRSWRHAEGLKRLARKFTEDTSSHTVFEEYYERHKIRDTEPSLLVDDLPTLRSPQRLHPRHTRSRSISETGAVLVPGQTLSQFHPALSLGEFMDTFGPLVFPIYRAALARKRILLVTHAPVEMACNFVYDISILSNIPLSVVDLLSVGPARLKPLFNVGVHDIPLLEHEAKTRAGPLNPDVVEGEHGAWVACTTDEVLCIKRNLWDVVIRLPPQHAKYAKEKVWPTAEHSSGVPLLATQRDLRRYRALTKSLKNRYRRKQSLFLDDEDDDAGNPIIRAPGDVDDDDDHEPNNIEELCEKLTWREIAYSSFIWWASAGEQQRSDAEAEDGRLLMDSQFAYTPTTAPDYAQQQNQQTDDSDTEPLQATTSSSASPEPVARRRPRRGSLLRRRSTNLRQEGVGSEEMDVIAYFHRMTQRIFSGLADRLDEDDEREEGDDDDDGEELVDDKTTVVSLDEVERMGLDRYSEADVEMLKEIVVRWWGREVEVEKGRLRCCGVECG
ncbi:hypothetical protein BZA05DRAFT_403010 [Tricharina praecox]|uniref:uncharacterized protein n=1 Tax=Tricharina praecox TaxID=43433 RepID=UPI002220AEF8|nr:uncharacterized protein BZA05DRAFT_403010 [Tricharina praecox]KAI5848877.1 hypothetical protein BZA05DRAFT_403010 [Tricharina praecox]